MWELLLQRRPNRLMEKGTLENAWIEMDETLSDTNFSTENDILEIEPTKWISNSATSSWKLCSS